VNLETQITHGSESLYRDFSKAKVLMTASEVVAFMKEDPLDRVLTYSRDLTPAQYDANGLSTRTDDGVLVVYSMRALGASTIEEFSNLRNRPDSYQAFPDEIAVVGDEQVRDRFGRVTPPCIKQLLRDAEEQKPDRQLAWAKYEGVCVLVDHPEAELATGFAGVLDCVKQHAAAGGLGVFDSVKQQVAVGNRLRGEFVASHYPPNSKEGNAVHPICGLYYRIMIEDVPH
jgi:hypothetical protein